VGEKAQPKKLGLPGWPATIPTLINSK